MDEVTRISLLILVIALCLPLFSRLLQRCPKLLKFGKYLILAGYIFVNLYETLLFRSIKPKALLMSPFWSYREVFSLGANGLWHSVLTGNIRITNPKLLKEILLNILLYVPLGYLLPFVWPKLEKKRLVVPIGFLCSCATELTQLLFRLGWCELDDIVGNTLGCFLGCLLYKLLMKKNRGK